MLTAIAAMPVNTTSDNVHEHVGVRAPIVLRSGPALYRVYRKLG